MEFNKYLHLTLARINFEFCHNWMIFWDLNGNWMIFWDLNGNWMIFWDSGGNWMIFWDLSFQNMVSITQLWDSLC